MAGVCVVADINDDDDGGGGDGSGCTDTQNAAFGVLAEAPYFQRCFLCSYPV